ncbi:MAG: peptide chain release factor 3 [SAR202 cluster bacterium]|nr:peptide chain release factor 3 [SAR202 cluster bacterium]
MVEQPASGPARSLAQEVARRRTFAIISHPDAGKTTLTEKLLLYAGAVELAGAVRSRGNQRHATSDWMLMEQERGISITATALEMEYHGYHINLLDTPGHQDFSEDTYRTLMAVDSAVMVLDSAKGIEPQTEKLFHVCRMRGIPILTFINKMDHEGRAPLELLDEIERILGIGTAALNWPIGSGDQFQGVYDLRGGRVLRFERTLRNQSRAPVKVAGLDDPELAGLIGEGPQRALKEDVDLLAGVGGAFDHARFLKGEITPVFFGSALNNFGVEPFLDSLLELAPAPGPRETDRGFIEPSDKETTGFIFKIQANMDPRHRDRMAFLRICSGHFQTGMAVNHTRLGKSIRLARVYRLFGRDRESIDEAFPGDVVGVVSPGHFAIGDTITTGGPIGFPGIPRFAPENFAVIMNTEISRYKQFNKGLLQLEEEGATQVLYSPHSTRREPILAVVGALQFDVVMARLKDEYGVDARLERLSYTLARWITNPGNPPARLILPRNVLQCTDSRDRPVLLFQSAWELRYTQEENPKVVFSDVG